MTHSFAVRSVGRLIECLLPRDLSEVVVGDLFEELELRMQQTRPKRAVWWFMLQSARSVPQLLFLSVRRWSWFKSVGVAAVAFVALNELEPLVRRWLASNFQPGVGQQIFVSLLIGFAACACGGFLSTWMRRGSAWLYSMIGASFMVAALARADTNERLWILTAFLVIAIVAPIIGGMCFISVENRWHKRRRN